MTTKTVYTKEPTHIKGREVVYKPVEKLKPIYTGGTLTPPKFMPSFYEWLSLKGQVITEYRGTTGTIYTVPKDKTLFITSLWATINHNAQGYYRISAFANPILMCGCATNNSSSVTSSLVLPLRVRSESVVSSAVVGTGMGGFIGFLVNNTLIVGF